jgi:hypothetical protein
MQLQKLRLPAPRMVPAVVASAGVNSQLLQPAHHFIEMIIEFFMGQLLHGLILMQKTEDSFMAVIF